VARIGRGTGAPIGPLAAIVETGGGRVALASGNPCSTCSLCCRSYLVPLCGHDVWSISRNLGLEPAQFTIAWQEEEPSVDGFRLERDGPLFSLVLDKRSWTQQQSACIFLMRLPGGHDRCGIYESRPAACRAYPMLLVEGRAQLRDDPLCAPNAWPAGEVGRPSWRDTLEAAHNHFDVYSVVRSVWDQRVRATETSHTLDEYYAYLLWAYDRVAGLHLNEVRAALY
jgi:Fe-S-cluster containining protein